MSGGGVLGDSAMAQTFGATVDVDAGDRGLYFVVGRNGSPETPDVAVRGVGGEVVLRLPRARKLLAVLPVAAEHYVQRHDAVALAGRVTIDPQRFQSFVELISLDASADDGPDH